MMKFFDKLKSALSRTTENVGDALRGIVGLPNGRVPDDILQELEDALILADVGLDLTDEFIAGLKAHRFAEDATTENVKVWLAEKIAAKLKPCEKEFILPNSAPAVLLFVGVNGSGKTTTIGKLASKFNSTGKTVLLAAGDTFRAGAGEQLEIWAKRAKAEIITAKSNTDSPALMFKAYEKTKETGVDILMCDTAGRLQNRTDLMQELEKIVRVLGKEDATAPHETLLVIDATVGQNAMAQVAVFNEISQLTGLVITKLDSSAKAGIIIALAEKFALPIYFIGVGESIEDLQPFNAVEFATALVG